MTPFVTAAIAALAVAIPTLIIIAGVLMPLVRQYVDGHLNAADAAKLKSAVKGAYMIVSKIAEATPGFPLDDGLAKVLEIASRELELARGRPLTPQEIDRARLLALSMHADDGFQGQLGADNGAALRERVTQIVTKRAP